jgi:hypothetical protein
MNELECAYIDFSVDIIINYLEKNDLILTAEIIYLKISKIIFRLQTYNNNILNNYIQGYILIEEIKKNMNRNNLIKKMIIMILNNNSINFNNIIVHKYRFIDYNVSFGSIIMFMLLFVYENTIYNVRASNRIIAIRIGDIHNEEQLELFIKSGVFDSVNMDYISKMLNQDSFVIKNCLTEFNNYFRNGSGKYVDEINYNLVKWLNHDVTDLIIQYWKKY